MGRPKPPPPMKVLVNNADSLVGTAVVEALKKEGHTVFALTTPDASAPPEGMKAICMDNITPEFVDELLSVLLRSFSWLLTVVPQLDGFIFQLQGHAQQSMDVLQVRLLLPSEPSASRAGACGVRSA